MSENCPYCFNVDTQFKNIPLLDEWSVYVNVFRNKLRVSYADSYSGEQVGKIEINFCPKCGKKLEKYSEEDEFEI